MTKSEQIATIVAELTEEESRQLGNMLLKRAENMQAEEAEKARMEFIKAYQKYRGLAPTATHLITVETDDYDIDIDLYEYMDDYL
jgi:tellurite resistance-related uncharacterized protein